MKTKKILFLLVFLSAGIISCQKDSVNDNGVPAGQNNLRLLLVDGPSLVFDSIFIDIRQVEIRVEKTDGSEVWQDLHIQPAIYNILRLRNGIEAEIANTLIPDGRIDKLRLTLGTSNSVVKAGVSYPLYLHNNVNQYTISIDDDTDEDGDADHRKFWLDFDGHGSIIETSPNHFELVASLRHFSHHNSGELEGKIRPAAALPAIVQAISGSDTLSAVPEHEGEFKIRGIHTSTVKLIIRASNNYKDSVINSINIRQGEDTNIGTVVLHQ